MRKSRACSLAAVLMILIGIFTSADEAPAQSGRRLPKSVPTPAPAPTPEPSPESKPPPKPDFIVKVYYYVDLGSTFGFPMPERMYTWAVERLRKTTLLDVRSAGEANRRDAIKQAKVETEAYVALLELQSNSFGTSGSTSPSAMSIYLTVYHPVSSKVKFSRTLALGQNSTRLPGSKTILQACNPGVYGNELLLLEASIEAADSVMSTFNVPLPPLCRSINPI